MSVEPVKRSVTLSSSTSVRSKLNEQLNKLHVKHNAEVELLEDLKLFTRQRAVLEKQYAEGLHRLVTQYSNKREIQPPPDLPGFERHNNRGLMEVWKALLEKTDDLSKRRLTMSELLVSQVSEVMKQQKRIKEANFKRLIEICQKMNSELLESAKEYSSSKKMYGELEKVCEEARTKYSEAEAKLKKRDLKFFESRSTLEKNHGKASERLKSCQKRTTCGRNDHLLAVEMTNAHLKRHGTRDLPQIMLGMDGETYNKIRDAYALYAQLETDAAVFVKAEFEDLAEQANLVNREYVLECFLHRNPVLREIQAYNFEPYSQDTVTAISRDHGAEIFLDKDARKWANKLTKVQMSITSLRKQVKGLQSVTSAYIKNPEFGTSDAQAEALQKTDMLLEEIRQFEVQVTKAEARLECLRQAGIDTNKWLQKAEKNQNHNNKMGGSGGSATELTPASISSQGRVSQLSLQSSSTGGGSQDFDVETSSINSGYAGHDDATSMGSNKSDTPKHCIVLYQYTAQRSDELNITKDEELEVLEWDDGDGWCKGKNKSGQEGYFPQSYVQSISRSSSPMNGVDTTTTSQHPVMTIGSSNTVSSLTSESLSVTPAHSSVQVNGIDKRTLLKAVYEYTAQFNEELSFPEGATIELLRTDENGIDDGWWEGSYQGKVGVFPSLVVEIIKDKVGSPDLNSTITAEPSSLYHPPPPPESPPPLPPDYSLPPVSPYDVTDGGVGPSASLVPDNSYHTSSTPINFSRAPPFQGGKKVEYRLDSFDSDLDEGSLV